MIRALYSLLSSWSGDYGKIEKKHGYIQWLFPIKHVRTCVCAPLQHLSETI